MVQLTWRDDEMLEWLSVVQIADMDAVRWALGALLNPSAGQPVSLRNAQRWVSRATQMGVVAKARPNYHAGTVVWPTQLAKAPRLWRQTMRHELAVASVSARFLAHGCRWVRDRRPRSLQDHQADGVVIVGERRELVEVELTSKTLARYKLIHTSHARRMTEEGIDRVLYFGPPEVMRTVDREANQHLFRDLRPRLVTAPVLDTQGRWVGDATQLLTGPASDAAVVDAAVAVPAQLWDRRVG